MPSKRPSLAERFLDPSRQLVGVAYSVSLDSEGPGERDHIDFPPGDIHAFKAAFARPRIPGPEPPTRRGRLLGEPRLRRTRRERPYRLPAWRYPCLQSGLRSPA